MESTMQTSKIYPGHLYAYKRGSEWVRFRVESIETSRTSSGTTSKIVGWILEDRKAEGITPPTIKLEPASLDGPYEVKAELVARKQAEDEAVKQREAERRKHAMADRRALYAFVGEPVPQKADDYHQLFRVTSYGGDADITREGGKRLIEKIHSLQRKPKLAIVGTETGQDLIDPDHPVQQAISKTE